MVQSNINVYNIAVLERPLVRNTVTNGLIDRGANRFREVNVVKR